MISPCPECGGPRVSAPLYGDAAIGRGSWPVRHVTDLRCLACLECGYTALYAKDLDKLRKAARKHPKQLSTGEGPAIPQQRPQDEGTSEQRTIQTWEPERR
ncbi:hypothetical protein R8Z50_00310 [Longispora sp. K20-0274]|uniref:hypothetical protein n=1 Tax=Longispora sp. K20-0274 TaxID=3088255 RepID=UPI00399C3CA2